MSGSGTSSQLNPNIALQAGQGVTQPVNLLASYGQMQDIQRNALAIQSGQQDISSKLAIGDAVQQSIGPDGTIDQGKFRTLVSQSPDAAWGAQTAVGSSQDQQGQNY